MTAPYRTAATDRCAARAALAILLAAALVGVVFGWAIALVLAACVAVIVWALWPVITDRAAGR